MYRNFGLAEYLEEERICVGQEEFVMKEESRFFCSHGRVSDKH